MGLLGVSGDNAETVSERNILLRDRLAEGTVRQLPGYCSNRLINLKISNGEIVILKLWFSTAI